jgi:hypothetical protein
MARLFQSAYDYRCRVRLAGVPANLNHIRTPDTRSTRVTAHARTLQSNHANRVLFLPE